MIIGDVTYILIERANGARLLKEFETREEAEKAKAELIAQDPNYEDVLVIRWELGSEKPDTESGSSPLST